MEITLTKKKNYNLEPFGRFSIKWKTNQGWKPNIIPFDELQMKHDTCMPVTDEQDREIIKLMKKHKTDILTDGNKFYTRFGIGFGEVWHEKLQMYLNDEAFRLAVDDHDLKIKF